LPNSVRAGFGSGLSICADRRYLSPDGNGIDDFLDIEISVPRDAYLTLRVFDLQGRVVATVAEDLATTSGSISFDGIDDDGIRLGVGMYILLAEVSGSIEDQKRLVFAVVAR